MSFKDIYMLESVSDRGTRKSTGLIYSEETHVADELISEGKAKEINYPSLKSHEESVVTAVSEFEVRVTAINDNYRLSPEGKAEKITLLKEELKEKVNGFQEKFSHDLNVLKQAAKKTATSIDLDNSYNADKVRQTVGIVKTEISMASSFTQAIESINEQLTNIERDSALELLSQFSEIKSMLESKGEKMQARSDSARTVTINGAIRSTYEAIKEAASNENQRNANVEYKMLEAIEQYRGDIRGPYDRIVRKYK
ncbi:hypothetical protein [Bacillus mesophilum]|uniref:Uncharacterized protein n=1 Tax=Bacillus mesophilum TaxID=1071718 RepID=A0A7V7RM06_9BACI|nr:hypothetical protein [Bacillus mesophilum]KAB2332933.1 hypothetical protein F7732_12695 [Bacillus mesophilum]